MSIISNTIQNASTGLGGVGKGNEDSATLEFPLDLELSQRPVIRFVCLPHDTTKKIESICLPCPGNVTFTDAAEYATINMGDIAAGAEVINAFQQGGSITDKIGKAAKEAKTQAGSGGSLGAKMLLAKKLGMEGVSSAIGFAAKQVLNPRTNTTFSGNTLRNFQFDFKMIGQSPAEVRAIDRIQNTFRHNTYASEVGGRKLLLQYPAQWHVEFLDGNMNELEYMPKIFACYLTTAACTINAENNVWRTDMSPHEVSVSLSFQETKVLTRNEMEDLEMNSNRENADTRFMEQQADQLVQTQQKVLKSVIAEAAAAKRKMKND